MMYTHFRCLSSGLSAVIVITFVSSVVALLFWRLIDFRFNTIGTYAERERHQKANQSVSLQANGLNFSRGVLYKREKIRGWYLVCFCMLSDIACVVRQ